MTEIQRHESGFRSSYVWPNPAFPFRIYYDGPDARIFIIENIQHNWSWLLEWHKGIRETDYFFIYCGWYHSEAFAKEAEKIFEVLGLKKDQFFIMFNSPHEMDNFTPLGFQGDVIHHNAWLDENQVMRPLPGSPKYFDAVYVARRSSGKRHMLAAKVPRLALIAGINFGSAPPAPIPENPAYLNDAQLSPAEVCQKINQSWCGLILSHIEGGCFASSEYLLCGVPVVSTPSFGGRDVWYNDYNSIICDPAPEAVAEAVATLKERTPDPQRIRQDHIDLARTYRQRFVKQLQSVFDRFGVRDTDAATYFRENYFHKMRNSMTPDFKALFG